MSTPRVTIGLPVFNGGRYLAETLDSILNQDFTNFELVIGDNGSTDETRDIYQDVANRDSRITIYRSEVNRGAAWNYNRLVHLARAPYFKWATHDDLLKPAFISRCVKVLDSQPEISLCYTRAADIDEQSVITGDRFIPERATHERPSDRVRSILLVPSPCLEVLGVMRLAQLKRTKLIGAYVSSDRTLLLELALLGKFCQVPEQLLLHRDHQDRSIRRYSDSRVRNLWFSPSWEGRRSAPRWRLLREYSSAVRHSHLPITEFARSAGSIAQWSLKNSQGLVRDAGGYFLRNPRHTDFFAKSRGIR